MDSKTVILVIILAVIVGVMIFFGERVLTGNNIAISSLQTSNQKLTSPTPTPKPTPSYPPLESNSNLKDEVEKLNPPDFSGEYKALKDEVNQ